MTKVEILFFICWILVQTEVIFLFIEVHKLQNLIKQIKEEVLTWTTKLTEFFDKEGQEVEVDILKLINEDLLGIPSYPAEDNPYQE